MNPPSPAIVAQNAVRSLPRWIMLSLCAIYILAGFAGRDPWREVDTAAFGYMQAMARGDSAWVRPLIDGMAPDAPGLLQYWLGAWALKLLPATMPADMVARLPFMLALALALLCTWRAVFSLARTPGAQPVAFAFGGEASPTDYARALADGGLLALLACLGLAQFSHETSHTVLQLSAVCAIFFAASAMWFQPRLAAVTAFFSMLALALAGAPALAMLLGLGASMLALGMHTPKLPQRYSWAAWWGLCMAVAAAAAWMLGLWESRWINPWLQGRDLQSLIRLLIWFSWPSWPFAAWALWRWRQQLQQPRHNPHLIWPLWLWLLGLLYTVFTLDGDRYLILSLPAVAALAAFALPTFQRSLGALIDWLTLFFFTISAITIWVVWISVQTGVPAKPAENVQRLAIGFEPSFALFPFLVAVAATVSWLLLVLWRTRRHRAAIWKSLAVPAGGTVLGWVLLMTLWLPMLDYGRSYAPHVHAVARKLPGDVQCVRSLGLSPALTTAFRFHTSWQLQRGLDTAQPGHCDWLIATPAGWSAVDASSAAQWELVSQVSRPTDRRDRLLVLRRAP